MPGRQVQLNPQYRNPVDIRPPAQAPPSAPDQKLGNIAAILGASSNILSTAMSFADSFANYRAQKALPDMMEEAGRVFDEMESYDQDDFNDELQLRLEEVYNEYSSGYSGLTKDVIDAKWGQWKAQRVDQFETQINQRNREQEYGGIIAEMKNIETSKEAFETLAQSLVDKGYHSEQEVRQIAGEINSEKFVDAQIALYAGADDPTEVIDLLAQNEDGSWAVQFEGYEASAEERNAIVQGAGQMVQQRIDAERKQLNERSQTLFNTWRARWAANPGSISINDAKRSLDNEMLNDEHYNWWISRIEGWMADQQPDPSELHSKESERAKDLLYAMVPELMTQGLSSYTIESLIMTESQKMGFGNELAQDVLDDFRGQMDDLEGNRMLNSLVEPLTERAKNDPSISSDIAILKTELRRELREKGTITDGMRARVNAEMLRFDSRKAQEQLEMKPRFMRSDIFSDWDQMSWTFKRDITREEDIQAMEPIERVISATSWGGLDYLREVAPERAAEVQSMTEDVKPILDRFFRNWANDDEAVGQMDPTTGMLTYTKSDGSQWRPVVKNNLATFERIGAQTPEATVWDFMDDLRVELGLYRFMRIAEDGFIYGVSSMSGRDGRPEVQQLRRATPSELQKFMSIGGDTGNAYPSRRFDRIMELKYE